jgi:hypothetical protein
MSFVIALYFCCAFGLCVCDIRCDQWWGEGVIWHMYVQRLAE